MPSLRAPIVAGLLLAAVLAGDVGHGDERAADGAVAAAVLARLTAALGDASVIEIQVAGNVVTLSGSVADQHTRDIAVKEAYGVAGVERVDDRLRIMAPPANPRGM